MENSPKCLNNRIFKKSFRQEKCFKKIPNKLRVILRTCKIVFANKVFVLTIEFVGTNTGITMECQTFSLVRNKLTYEKYSTNVNTYTYRNLANTVHIDFLKKKNVRICTRNISLNNCLTRKYVQ